MGTSKQDRKYNKKDTKMDTNTNKVFRVLINGERLVKVDYHSYFAASQAGDNLIKNTNDYYEILME